MLRKFMAVFLIVLVTGLCLVPIAWMQGNIQVVLKEPDLANFPTINLPTVVLSPNGVPISGLDAGNFEVLEDNSPLTIKQVLIKSDANLSLSIALVLDLSGSAPIENIKEGAHRLLDSLSTNDRVAIIGFNTPVSIDTYDPNKEIAFTSDLNAARALIDKFTIIGKSAVYEAIYKGILITAEEKANRRAVIVMTDGYDNASRPHIASADTPIVAAKEKGIPIFTIGVYGELPKDPDYLKVLARETGGQYKEVTDITQLGTLFQEIVDQLRAEYHIVFTSNLKPDAKDHKLKVRVHSPQGSGEAERIVTYPAPSLPVISRPSMPSAVKPVSGWAIAAIVIVSVIAVGLVLFFALRRREKYPAFAPPTTIAPTIEQPEVPPAPVPPAPPLAAGPVPEARGRPEAKPFPETMVSPTPAETIILRPELPVIGWLVVVKGTRQGQEFVLREVTTIGRGGENDIVLDDPAVSRQHAKIRLEGRDFVIYNLGATNPPKVNDVEINRHVLADGDRLEIGQTILVFKQVKLS
ncbi:MAG: FHA domain-containing protein [Candidatus Methanomethyliaceae archaeon]